VQLWTYPQYVDHSILNVSRTKLTFALQLLIVHHVYLPSRQIFSVLLRSHTSSAYHALRLFVIQSPYRFFPSSSSLFLLGALVIMISDACINSSTSSSSDSEGHWNQTCIPQEEKRSYMHKLWMHRHSWRQHVVTHCLPELNRSCITPFRSQIECCYHSHKYYLGHLTGYIRMKPLHFERKPEH
jgi:hypothetical protein